MPFEQTPVFVFADANIFLEYTRLDDVAWRSVFSGRPLVFAVCVHTVSEVDAKRNSSSARLRRRAQAITSWLLTLADGAGVLQNGAKLDFISGSPVALLDRGDFDRHNPDDVLVASALQFKEEHPERETCVLSEDTGVVLKSRGFTLLGRQPPQELRLKSEPSDEERRIEVLESRIAELEMGSPRVAVTCKGNPTQISVNRVNSEEDVVTKAMERERRACSRVPPGEVEKYLTKYEAYARAWYKGQRQILRAFDVPLTLSNIDGRAPALGVHLQLAAPADLAFFTSLPKPPDHPIRPATHDEVTASRSRKFSPSWPELRSFPDLSHMIERPWDNVGSWEIEPSNEALIIVRKLVHGRDLELPRLLAWFTGEVANFNASWIAHVENNPTPFKGALHFVVDEERSDQGGIELIKDLRVD
jgi:hypothetical protein